MDDEHAMTPAQREESRRALEVGLEITGLDWPQLWTSYVALGGPRPERLAAALNGDRPITAYEHDVVAQAINEVFLEHGEDHPVPYSDQLPRARARPGD